MKGFGNNNGKNLLGNLLLGASRRGGNDGIIERRKARHTVNIQGAGSWVFSMYSG